MKHTRLQIALVCLLLVGAGLLYAGPASGQASARRAQSITAEFFDSQDSDRDIQMVTLGLGLGKELVRTLYGHVEAKLALTTGRRFDEDDPGVPEREADGLGAGLLGLIRWSPLRLWAVEPYVEASSGMVFTLEAFPPGGTVWNFWSRWGVGVSIGILGEVALVVGLRRLHISNGKGFGHPRNPAYDGAGVVVGLRR